MQKLINVSGSAPITEPGKVVTHDSGVRLTRAVVAMAADRLVMIDHDAQADSVKVSSFDAKGRRTQPVDAQPQFRGRLLQMMAGRACDRLFITASRRGRYTLIHALALDCGRLGCYEGVITIGGERWMVGGSLGAVIQRAPELASGMAWKSAAAAPGCPGVAGRGKKGTFAFFDDKGRPHVPNDDEFVNHYIDHATNSFPSINELLLGRSLGDSEVAPVSSSPDVKTGSVWGKIAAGLGSAGLSTGQFTVRPKSMDGFGVSSADPTAAGVVAAVTTMAKCRGVGLNGLPVFIDGGGEVTCDTLNYFRNAGIDMSDVTVADPSPERANILRAEFTGVRVLEMPTQEALRIRNASRIGLLVLNGPGNQILEEDLDIAIARGCRFIAGGANDLFDIRSDKVCAQLLAGAGVWAVPAPLQNHGGWTLALSGQLAEAAGIPRDDALVERVRARTREVTRASVLEAIDLARADEDGEGGLDIYAAGQALIRQRLDEVRSLSLTPTSAGDLLERLLGHSNA